MKRYLQYLKDDDNKLHIGGIYDILETTNSYYIICVKGEFKYVPHYHTDFSKWYNILTENDVRRMKLAQLNKNKL